MQEISSDPMSGWDLAIFDCDGVLVDSETITHQVLIDALADLGLDLDLGEAIDLFMGNTLVETVAIIESRLGTPLPENFFPEWRERLYVTLRELPVQPVEGIVEVLDVLDCHLCVVSNGPFRKMETTLGATGLLSRFQGKLYSPEAGYRGKPAPDMFIAAAERFGVDPGRAFVVEDSPKGVRGALAAGMAVFGYAGAEHTDAEVLRREGAQVFTDMRHLPRLLENRGRQLVPGPASSS